MWLLRFCVCHRPSSIHRQTLSTVWRGTGLILSALYVRISSKVSYQYDWNASKKGWQRLQEKEKKSSHWGSNPGPPHSPSVLYECDALPTELCERALGSILTSTTHSNRTFLFPAVALYPGLMSFSRKWRNDNIQTLGFVMLDKFQIFLLRTGSLHICNLHYGMWNVFRRSNNENGISLFTVNALPGTSIGILFTCNQTDFFILHLNSPCLHFHTDMNSTRIKSTAISTDFC